MRDEHDDRQRADSPSSSAEIATTDIALPGHPLDVTPARICAAEATGAFFLVLAIISTAIAATLAKPVAGVPYGSLAVPIAGGLVLAAAAARVLAGTQPDQSYPGTRDRSAVLPSGMILRARSI